MLDSKTKAHQPLVPVWCRDFSSAATKTCPHSKVDFVRGRMLDSLLNQNGRLHKEQTLNESSSEGNTFGRILRFKA
jgi:hypothetical protein